MIAENIGIFGLAAFALVAGASYFLIIVYLRRARVARRMRLASGGSGKSRAERRIAEHATGIKTKLGSGIAVLGRLMPLGEGDRQKINVRLQRAGYRSSNSISTVLGMKFSCLVAGLILGLIFLTDLLPGSLGLLAGAIGGLLVGVVLNIVPEMWLGRIASRRLRRIESGLAELFDLLVVCLESGLTFDRALRRAVDSLRSFQSDLANVFGQVVLDIRVHGRTREDALGRLARRLDSQQFRDLAMTVSQSERHGTPMADALRKLAKSARVDAVSRMQEKLARLPTLLIVPSIACVLPGIMVIVGGPAFVQLMESLDGFAGS